MCLFFVHLGQAYLLTYCPSYHRQLGQQTGTSLSHVYLPIPQVLKLEDGSDAIVKQVTNDADGSTVYHITCLNVNSSTSIPSLTHYQHQQDQGAQPQINQEISDADSLALSQEATVKVENTEIIASQDHASYQASDIPKVEDLAAVTTENHKTGVTN